MTSWPEGFKLSPTDGIDWNSKLVTVWNQTKAKVLENAMEYKENLN
jgi:hypothetical protein